MNVYIYIDLRSKGVGREGGREGGRERGRDSFAWTGKNS